MGVVILFGTGGLITLAIGSQYLDNVTFPGKAFAALGFAWLRVVNGNLLSVWLRILEFEPATGGQSIVHAEVLRALNTLVEFRRQRIEATSYAVPSTLWVVVLIGAVLSIFASYLFNVDSLLVQSLLSMLLASMIALRVFFIATTDHPYRGVNAIEPKAYEIVLRNLTDYP